VNGLVPGDNGNSVNQEFVDMDFFFSLTFSCELLVRIVALRWHFWLGIVWRWNMFDVVVVSGAVLESIIGVSSMNATFLRLLRILPIVRTVQVVRKTAAVCKLGSHAAGDFGVGCFAALGDFGTRWLHAVVRGRHRTGGLGVPDLRSVRRVSCERVDDFFHSVPMTLLTLCMSITGGINWWELEEAFIDFSPFCAMMFFVYQAIMVLALLNIVTGIFVNDSINVSQSDRDFKRITLTQKKSESIKVLCEIFKEIDADSSGAVSLHEFMAGVKKPDVRLTLESLGVDIPNAVRLFETLDVDDQMHLEIDEFVAACSALSVSATTIDMEMMKTQNRKIVQMISKLATAMDGDVLN